MLQSDWTAKFLQRSKSGYSDVTQPPTFLHGGWALPNYSLPGTLWEESCGNSHTTVTCTAPDLVQGREGFPSNQLCLVGFVHLKIHPSIMVLLNCLTRNQIFVRGQVEQQIFEPQSICGAGQWVQMEPVNLL